MRVWVLLQGDDEVVRVLGVFSASYLAEVARQVLFDRYGALSEEARALVAPHGLRQQGALTWERFMQAHPIEVRPVDSLSNLYVPLGVR